MAELRLDVAAVRSLADQVLDGADRISKIAWPTIELDALMGSAAAQATVAPVLVDHTADVVARMRTWADTARASAAAVDAAQLRHARQLGDGR